MYSIAARQAETLETARRTGTHWTQAELDQVRSASAPADQLARQLERTLYAVYSARRVHTELAARAPKTPARTLPFERGFTDIESLFLGD